MPSRIRSCTPCPLVEVREVHRGTLSHLNPDCHATFIGFLLGLGVPEWVADLIETMAGGDISSARAALTQVKVMA